MNTEHPVITFGSCWFHRFIIFRKIKAEEDKLKAARLERTKAETNLQEEKENRQFMLDSFDRLLRQIADPFAGHATDESSNNNNNNW